jgi:hypothetical protein
MSFHHKSKKAMMYQEVVIIAFSLVLSGLFLFLSVSAATTFGGKLEYLNPELKSEFESVYVYTFLNVELEEEDKELFFLDKTGDYRVKDLIWYNSEESIKRLNYYRDNYIIETEDYIKNYYSNILKTEFVKNNILNIEATKCVNIDIKSFREKNSVYYIKAREGYDSSISPYNSVIIFFDFSFNSQTNERLTCGNSIITGRTLAPIKN